MATQLAESTIINMGMTLSDYQQYHQQDSLLELLIQTDSLAGIVRSLLEDRRI